MKKTAIVLLCTLGALSARAQSPAGGEAGIDSITDLSPATAEFVKKVAQSDLFEIQSSQLVADKNDTADRDFANRMIADHQKTTADLQGLVRSGAVKAQPPTEMAPSQKRKLAKLNGETGAEFAKDYRKIQISAHKDAVSLFRSYAKDGDNAQLKDWAHKTLPTLREHLRMAKALDKSA